MEYNLDNFILLKERVRTLEEENQKLREKINEAEECIEWNGDQKKCSECNKYIYYDDVCYRCGDHLCEDTETDCNDDDCGNTFCSKCSVFPNLMCCNKDNIKCDKKCDFTLCGGNYIGYKCQYPVYESEIKGSDKYCIGCLKRKEVIHHLTIN